LIKVYDWEVLGLSDIISYDVVMYLKQEEYQEMLDLTLIKQKYYWELIKDQTVQGDYSIYLPLVPFAGTYALALYCRTPYETVVRTIDVELSVDITLIEIVKAEAWKIEAQELTDLDEIQTLS
jgi:hypothetical protein